MDSQPIVTYDQIYIYISISLVQTLFASICICHITQTNGNINKIHKIIKIQFSCFSVSGISAYLVSVCH